MSFYITDFCQSICQKKDVIKFVVHSDKFNHVYQDMLSKGLRLDPACLVGLTARPTSIFSHLKTKVPSLIQSSLAFALVGLL